MGGCSLTGSCDTGKGPGIRMCVNPVEQQFVIAWFGAQDKAQVMILEVFDMGAIGGQGILDDNGLEVGMFLTEGCDEALGGIAFTIVFVGPVLLVDHLGSKWKNDGAVGMNEGPGKHLVLIGGAPITMMFLTAGRTLDLFGGIIPRTVHGKEVITAHDREMGKDLASLQRPVDGIEGSSQ